MLILGMAVFCKESVSEDVQLTQVQQLHGDHTYKYSKSYDRQRKAYLWEVAEMVGMVLGTALVTFMVCKGIVAGITASQDIVATFEDSLLN